MAGADVLVRTDGGTLAAWLTPARLELEAATMTLAESQLALAALAILRRLLRRVRPTLVRRIR